MKNWLNIINQDIGVFAPSHNERSVDSLFNKISPLTKYLLNTFINVMNKKNLIIIFPDEFLRPITLLSYSFSKINNKSTLIFSYDSRINFRARKINHNHNYYLLNYKTLKRQDYLFKDIPIFYLDNNKLDMDIYLPRATRSYKTDAIKNIKYNLSNSDLPKIILNNDKDFTKINQIVDKILINKEEIELSEIKNKTKLNLGAIFFENASHYINSDFTCENFVKWIKETVSDDVSLILHFSTSDYKHIDYIKNELNCIVIPFTPEIILNNEELLKNTSNYYEKLNYDDLKIVTRFNLDKPYHSTKKFNLKYYDDPLKVGNIDHYITEIFKHIHNLNYDKIKNKRLISKSKFLAYSFCNLTINPQFFKFKMSDQYNHWKYYTCPEFFNIFQEAIEKEDSENQYRLNQILNSLKSLFYELSRCKRYNEEKSYTRIGKDYKILEIAANKKKYFKYDLDLIICTLFDSEPKILNKYLEENNIHNVKVEYIRNLTRSNINKNEYNLLIPGLMQKRFINELNEPYNEILMLSYEGKHNELVNQQINNILNPDENMEEKCMNYFKESYDYLKLPKNDLFFQDFKSRFQKQNKTKNIPEKEKEIKTSINNSEKSLSEIINENLSNYQYIINDWDETTFKNNITSNNSSKTPEDNVETIKFNLRNVENNTNIIKELPINRTYFSFKSLDSVESKSEEIPPTLFKEGEYIVVIENNEKTSLLDLIVEIYGFKNKIDTEFIEYWKTELLTYINTKNISFREFHDIYTENGGQRHYQTTLLWAKGNVIGPNDRNDLLIIGKTINDEYIIENYENMMEEIEKIRNLHKIIGRKFKKIINQIMNENTLLDTTNFSLEEYSLYQSIKNGIYEVIEKID